MRAVTGAAAPDYRLYPIHRGPCTEHFEHKLELAQRGRRVWPKGSGGPCCAFTIRNSLQRPDGLVFLPWLNI